MILAIQKMFFIQCSFFVYDKSFFSLETTKSLRSSQIKHWKPTILIQHTYSIVFQNVKIVAII